MIDMISAEPLPLHEQRTPEILARIDQEYELASRGGSTHCNKFVVLGDNQDYLFDLPSGMLSAQVEIARRAQQRTPTAPLRVLDIGGAQCGMLLEASRVNGQTVEFTTVNAMDYLPQHIIDGAYLDGTLRIRQIVGNAERMHELGLEHFDLIFSHLAIEHFADSFSGLEQAARLLKPGGRLIANRAIIYANSIQEDVIDALLEYSGGTRRIEGPDHTMQWVDTESRHYRGASGIIGIDIMRKANSNNLPVLFPMLEYAPITDPAQLISGIPLQRKK